MALPSPAYPSATFGGNEQDTSNDVPGNDTIANADDYNKLATEIVAVESDLRAGLSAISKANMAAALAEFNKVPDSLNDSYLWIGAADFQPIDGTWSWSLDASGLWVLERDTDAGFNGVTAPLRIRGRDSSGGDRGWYIYRLWLIYKIATAALDDVAVTLNHFTIPSHGGAPSGVTSSNNGYDSNHDSAAKRAAVGNHTCVVSVDEPLDDFGWEFIVGVDGDAGAAGVFSLFGAFLLLIDYPR